MRYGAPAGRARFLKRMHPMGQLPFSGWFVGNGLDRSVQFCGSHPFPRRGGVTPPYRAIKNPCAVGAGYAPPAVWRWRQFYGYSVGASIARPLQPSRWVYRQPARRAHPLKIQTLTARSIAVFFHLEALEYVALFDVLELAQGMPHSKPSATSLASSLKRFRLAMESSQMTIPSRTRRSWASRVILPSVTRQPATVPTLEILYT